MPGDTVLGREMALTAKGAEIGFPEAAPASTNRSFAGAGWRVAVQCEVPSGRPFGTLAGRGLRALRPQIQKR